MFTQENSKVTEVNVMKMEVSLSKRENPSKRRRVGGVQIKLEAAFGKAAKLRYDDALLKFKEDHIIIFFILLALISYIAMIVLVCRH